jgi:hypothetical protein
MVKRYQRGNQNLYIEEEQTTQWPKDRVQKDKQRSTKHMYKTKDRVTQTSLKIRDEHKCFEMILEISCAHDTVILEISCAHDTVGHHSDTPFHKCNSVYILQTYHYFVLQYLYHSFRATA